MVQYCLVQAPVSPLGCLAHASILSMPRCPSVAQHTPCIHCCQWPISAQYSKMHVFCLVRSQTPPPGPSGRAAADYAPANIWGSAVAAHQAAAGGGSTRTPSPSTSSYHPPQPPPPPSTSYSPQQSQQQQQQQGRPEPSRAVVSVWLLNMHPCGIGIA